MHAAELYDYAIVRVVPRVEREEFINAGAILSCQRTGFLQAAMELDEARLHAKPGDLEIVVLQREAGARIGELRLIEPGEHIVARDLLLHGQQRGGVIVAARLILRAARLHGAAHLAEQPDLILRVEAEREVAAHAAAHVLLYCNARGTFSIRRLPK